MKQSERLMWTLVDAGLNPATTSEERRFCRVMDLVDEGVLSDGRVEPVAEEVLGYLVRARPFLKKARGSGLTGDGSTEANGRWRLLADLDAARLESTRWHQAPRWAPVEVRADFAPGSALGTPARQVEVSVTFDGRMSQRSLFAELRKLWPMMSAARMVRQTRPLTPRAANLIRMVCLERGAEDDWKGYLKAWNEKYPDMAYKYPSHLRSDFHKFEAQLTGIDEQGLEWYYDPLARLNDAEIDDLADRGDEGAIARRAWREWRSANPRGFRDPTDEYDDSENPTWGEVHGLAISR